MKIYMIEKQDDATVLSVVDNSLSQTLRFRANGSLQGNLDTAFAAKYPEIMAMAIFGGVTLENTITYFRNHGFRQAALTE